MLVLTPIALVEPWHSLPRFVLSLVLCPPLMGGIFYGLILIGSKQEHCLDPWLIILATVLAVWTVLKLALSMLRPAL